MRCERDINPVIHHLEEPSPIHQIKGRQDNASREKLFFGKRASVIHVTTLAITLFFMFLLSFLLTGEYTFWLLTDSLFTFEICRTLVTSNVLPLSFPFRFLCHFYCVTFFFKLLLIQTKFILKMVFSNKQVGVTMTHTWIPGMPSLNLSCIISSLDWESSSFSSLCPDTDREYISIRSKPILATPFQIRYYSWIILLIELCKFSITESVAKINTTGSSVRIYVFSILCFLDHSKDFLGQKHVQNLKSH
jgi:hypothetical protein